MYCLSLDLLLIISELLTEDTLKICWIPIQLLLKFLMVVF
jgi:hypothetical protein